MCNAAAISSVEAGGPLTFWKRNMLSGLSRWGRGTRGPFTGLHHKSFYPFSLRLKIFLARWGFIRRAKHRRAGRLPVGVRGRAGKGKTKGGGGGPGPPLFFSA